MYDPVMSVFLSVDNYVQSPENSQNFNRYSYCLNNPLKYTDPSGWMMSGAWIGTPTQGVTDCTNTMLEMRDVIGAGVHVVVDGEISNSLYMYMEGEKLKNGGSGSENTNPQDDWFVNENTGEIYYNNKMGKGDEGKGDMTGSGWKWLGPNGMFNKINPGFLGEEISLIAKLKGKIKITSEDFLMSLLLAGDKAEKVMEDLGYQQVPTQAVEFNDTYDQVVDGPGGASFHITYGTSIEYTEKVTYVPNDYVEMNRICLGTLYGDYNVFTNSTPYVSRYSISYGEPSFLRKIGGFLKIGVGIHDYTNYYNGGNIINGYNGNNQLIIDFLNVRP